MDDNANLEKMTRTNLLMTEGEWRRGRGGEGEDLMSKTHS